MTMDVDLGSAGGHDLDEDLDDDEDNDFGTKAKKGRGAAAKKTTTKKVTAPKSMSLIR